MPDVRRPLDLSPETGSASYAPARGRGKRVKGAMKCPSMGMAGVPVVGSDAGGSPDVGGHVWGGGLTGDSVDPGRDGGRRHEVSRGHGGRARLPTVHPTSGLWQLLENRNPWCCRVRTPVAGERRTKAVRAGPVCPRRPRDDPGAAFRAPPPPAHRVHGGLLAVISFRSGRPRPVLGRGFLTLGRVVTGLRTWLPHALGGRGGTSDTEQLHVTPARHAAGHRPRPCSCTVARLRPRSMHL